MERCLNEYAAIAEEFHFRPTLSVTASVLARHPDMIRSFSQRGIEFSIHGLVHADHKPLSLEWQHQSIERAETIFRELGIPYTGFRAPYLRYNSATDQALRLLGIQYHSSQVVAFSVLPHRNGSPPAAFQRALDYYDAYDARVTAARPAYRNGLIHIPVTVPDDEIMVDRLRLNDELQSAAWLGTLEATYGAGELFTVQLHPERIFDCRHALRAILSEAQGRRPSVWLAALDEISAWWLRRREFRLDVERVSDGCYRVHVLADDRATVLVRGMPGIPSTPWHGPDSVTQLRTYQVECGRKPVVGVSARTPASVLAFLREEGLPTEIASDPAGFGAYIDIEGPDWQEKAVLAAIEQAPGPLVRLWRWPAAARSALAITGDVDSITLQDFVLRVYEVSARGRTNAVRGRQAISKLGIPL